MVKNFTLKQLFRPQLQVGGEEKCKGCSDPATVMIDPFWTVPHPPLM